VARLEAGPRFLKLEKRRQYTPGYPRLSGFLEPARSAMTRARAWQERTERQLGVSNGNRRGPDMDRRRGRGDVTWAPPWIPS